MVDSEQLYPNCASFAAATHTKPMKQQAKGAICILRHSNYPAELNVRREAEALLNDGYQVHVVCLREVGEAAREEVGGVQVHRLPIRHRRGRISRYLFEYNAFFVLASIKLIWLHFKHRFRGIQVNTMPDYLVFAALVPRLMGARVVLHLHEPMPELFDTMFPGHAWLRTLIMWSERLSLAFADHVLTVTREMRDNICARGADASKTTVIVNVPDDQLFRFERHAGVASQISAMKAERGARGTFRVLCHGSIEERYGFDLIVRAIARMAKGIPGIEFRFMGKGEFLPEVLALARQLKIERHVTYLGFVPFGTMIEEILAADVTVVPMRRNPYSVLVHTNKMFEYLALQRPVVASRLDSVVAYFPDDAISYFEPDDANDLARRLNEVIADPQASAKRVEAATRLYEAYRWSEEKQKYLAVYSSLLEGHAQTAMLATERRSTTIETDVPGPIG
jgi:glycosyltransferase involved in cell wall biosynthesis